MGGLTEKTLDSGTEKCGGERQWEREGRLRVEESERDGEKETERERQTEVSLAFLFTQAESKVGCNPWSGVQRLS